MAQVKRRVFLTFPQGQIKEPVIYKLGHDFKVVTNIRQANIEKDLGWMIMEVEGEEKEVDRALEDLKKKKVGVQPAEADLVE